MSQRMQSTPQLSNQDSNSSVSREAILKQLNQMQLDQALEIAFEILLDPTSIPELREVARQFIFSQLEQIQIDQALNIAIRFFRDCSFGYELRAAVHQLIFGRLEQIQIELAFEMAVRILSHRLYYSFGLEFRKSANQLIIRRLNQIPIDQAPETVVKILSNELLSLPMPGIRQLIVKHIFGRIEQISINQAFETAVEILSNDSYKPQLRIEFWRWMMRRAFQMSLAQFLDMEIDHMILSESPFKPDSRDKIWVMEQICQISVEQFLGMGSAPIAFSSHLFDCEFRYKIIQWMLTTMNEMTLEELMAIKTSMESGSLYGGDGLGVTISQYITERQNRLAQAKIPNIPVQKPPGPPAQNGDHLLPEQDLPEPGSNIFVLS